MEDFDEDVDIDLSPLPKNDLSYLCIDTANPDELNIKNNFNLVKDHMRQFSSERYKRNIISCYRAKDTFVRTGFQQSFTFKRINEQLSELFFPIWILLALIPEEQERTLAIEKFVVTDGFQDDIVNHKIAQQLRPFVGKGSLIINKLTIMCESKELPNIMNLRRELQDLGNVTFKHVKVKMVLPIEYFLEKRIAASEGFDELKLLPDYKYMYTTEDSTDAIKKISDHLEDDDLSAEVPLIKGISDRLDSPHKMLGGPRALIRCPKSIPTDRILIAMLGYGCYQSMSTNETNPAINKHIIDKKNFTNCTAPIYHEMYYKFMKDDDVNKSKFVICQTTYCNGTIANGTTSKAIEWLREKWKEIWNNDYDNLLVLIPYGGQYMEDEMIQIHEATDEGIIIVCAAGELGGGVVFPAALGTVLSVGVADNGPKGREVDIHVNKADSCFDAAATITGLLAHFLSRINSLLKSDLTNPLNQALAGAIRDTPGHLHTCVIRELLVSEGNGSHDPQLGYGNGEKIINHLLSVADGVLLEKLANVFLIDGVSNTNKTTASSTIYSIKKIDDEMRKKLFHNLNGRGVSVTVLDQDREEKEEQIGENKTSFKLFPATGTYKRHGEECASVLQTICPNASILCANNVEDHYHLAFTDCMDHEPPIDVISYSISIFSFYYDMCRVVNEAVVAGKIIVFAAGNTGKKERNTVEYPGRIGNILVVGGRDESHNRIGFSSVGREMDFLAEGEIGTYSGTSYAAPVVAGYIALLLQFIKENMNTDQDKIRAWSKNKEGAYEWRDIPAFDAAHNVYAMRTLLKLLVPKPQDHTETEGFGCLDFSKLFPCYRIENSHELVTGSAKTKIHETLQKFYKRM